MKLLTTVILGASLLSPTILMAQDIGGEDDGGLRFTVSAGVISAPSYLGDDEQQTNAFPNVTVSYGDRFSASLDGIRYTAFSRNGFSAGAVGAYHFSRDENPDDNPFVVAGGDTTDLVGLGDIDGTIEVGGFVEYEAKQFSARLELRQGVNGGHDGLYSEAEVMYNDSFNVFSRPVFFSVGPSIAFGDDAYTSTFFDVNAAQSAASGISQFDAGAGLISYGLHTSAIVPITESISLVGFANYDQLTGDVGDSSLVQERGSENQTTVGLLLNYTF